MSSRARAKLLVMMCGKQNDDDENEDLAPARLPAPARPYDAPTSVADAVSNHGDTSSNSSPAPDILSDLSMIYVPEATVKAGNEPVCPVDPPVSPEDPPSNSCPAPNMPDLSMIDAPGSTDSSPGNAPIKSADHLVSLEEVPSNLTYSLRPDGSHGTLDILEPEDNTNTFILPAEILSNYRDFLEAGPSGYTAMPVQKKSSLNDFATDSSDSDDPAEKTTVANDSLDNSTCSDDSVADPLFIPNPVDQSSDNSMDSNLVSSSQPSDHIPTGAEVRATVATHVSRERRKRKSEKFDRRDDRSECKIKRTAGKEYTTKTGKVVPERKCIPLNPCRMRCSARFNDDIRQAIFNEYWTLKSHNQKMFFLAGLIEAKEPSLHRNKTVPVESQKTRLVTYEYRLRINGVSHFICKTCFMKTLNVSKKCLEIIQQKIRSSVSGAPDIADKRGQGSPGNKKTECDLENVRKHIESIPVYESHYTRREPEKKYLPPHYTITRLYEEYIKTGVRNPVSRNKYTEIFKTHHISKKKPNKDTCSKCDTFQMKISLASDLDKGSIQEEFNAHVAEADAAYLKKDADKKASVSEPTKKTLVFDLQQCLPTPNLTNSVAFYKRQLWTFNLTVHDCDTSQAYCFMWHEAMAGRGGNHIASCIYKFLSLHLPSGVREVTLYSDTCAGQNKNSHMLAMFLTALQDNPNITCIDHKFLVPGHTHMEVDTDHSLIEKKKKSTDFPIYHPHDWVQLVRLAGKKKPFLAIEMKRNDFHDFGGMLSESLQQGKKNSDGQNFYWRDVKWLRYVKGSPGLVYYKSSLDDITPFKEVCFRRRGRIIKLCPKLCYNGPVPICSKKKKDLLDLLNFIPECFHEFYKSLPISANNIDALHDDDAEAEE